MKPALTNPFCRVCIVSEGSIGEIVLPIIRHWMMCAIMNKFRVISAAARHRLVLDLRMPALLYPGTLTPAVVLREIPIVFNSRLMQPLFTKLANLGQNAALSQ